MAAEEEKIKNDAKAESEKAQQEAAAAGEAERASLERATNT